MKNKQKYRDYMLSKHYIFLVFVHVPCTLENINWTWVLSLNKNNIFDKKKILTGVYTHFTRKLLVWSPSRGDHGLDCNNRTLLYVLIMQFIQKFLARYSFPHLFSNMSKAFQSKILTPEFNYKIFTDIFRNLVKNSRSYV